MGWLNYAEPTIFLLFLFLFIYFLLFVFVLLIIKSKGVMKLLRLENEIEAVHNARYE